MSSYMERPAAMWESPGRSSREQRFGYIRGNSNSNNNNDNNNNNNNNNNILLTSPERAQSCEREDEFERLQETIGAAAELVFQQRLAVHRLNRGALHPPGGHQPLCTSGTGDAYNIAFKLLMDLEDNLSRETNRCIRSSNVTALHYLNDRQYSRALQVLLKVETIAEKGAGKWFPFFTTNTHSGSCDRDCMLQNVKGFVESVEDLRSGEDGGGGCMQELFVPFFTKRHEKMRQLALAVINNNIGLYHFKIAEYDLAVRRMSRALQVEELLGVETIGVTYFNIAQAQYECGCLEDAFSSISLAEEAVEKRIYECQSQKNRLHRIAEHGACGTRSSSTNVTTTVTPIPGLERRQLDVYIGWRESVCLLSRVLELHGRWLQNNKSYKAAIHRYEHSDRWLSSVKRLSAEENAWRQGLRQCIQECRRAQRHEGCCASKTPAFTSPASAEPRSIIVTTTLPRRIEIATCATPFDNYEIMNEEEEEGRRQNSRQHQRKGKKQKQRHGEGSGKPHYKDVYELAATPASVPRQQQYRTAPRRPEWDGRTNVLYTEEDTRKSTTRRKITTPTAATTTNSSTRTNSEARTSVRLTPTAGTPLSRGTKQEQRSSVNPASSNEMDLTSSDARRTQVPASNSHSRLLHGARVSPHVMAKRLWTTNNNNNNNNNSSNNNDSSSILTSSSSFLSNRDHSMSLMGCIHVLQAFARARISVFERDWRKLPPDVAFVSPTSRAHSSSSLSSSSSSSSCLTSLDDRPPHTHDIYRFKRHNDFPMRNSNGSAKKTASLHRKIASDPYEILLAFLAAHRSSSLVYQRRIEQRYAKVMASVMKQGDSPVCRSPFTRTMTMRDSSSQQRPRLDTNQHQHQQQHHRPGDTSAVSIPCSPPVDQPPRRNVETHQRCGETTGVRDSNGCTVNTVHLSEERRLHRRYNSLLRMSPSQQGEKYPDISLDAVTVNNYLSARDITSACMDDAEGRVYPNVSSMPRTSEDSCSHVSGVDDEASRPNRQSMHFSDHSATCKLNPHPRKGGDNHHHHHNQQSSVLSRSHEKTLKVVNSCKVIDRLNRNNVENPAQCGLPPRHFVFQRSSMLPRGNTESIAHTTVDILRHHLLREEAAIIIQGAWRSWRTRRQLSAVRKITYTYNVH